MYRSHFGLNQSPFNITPNPAFFYSGSKRGDILEALVYAVAHGEGIIKVTGEVGSGKTMLCRMLESMMPSHVEVIYLVNPTLSREEVMFTLAGELEIPTEGKRPDEVIRLLHKDLISKHINGKQVVLLVEEAQAMPLETLEEIRLFSNLETAHHKLLQIVLFGQPELDVNLNLPRMRQLKERITHSFTVPPLTYSLIPEYLMFRMRAAGYRGPDIFTRRAIKLMAEVSEGIVRRINILADKSLLAAFADNTHAIHIKHMKAAIDDSEFTHKSVTFLSRRVLIASIISLALLASGYGVWSSLQANSGVKNTVNHAAQIAAPQKTPVKIAAEVAKIPAVEPSPVALPVPAPANEGKNTVAPLEEKVTRTHFEQLIDDSKRFLSDTPQHYYTIQLTALNAEEDKKIELFMKTANEQLGAATVFLYPTKIGGVARFGIIFASFSTREAAWKKRMDLEQQWGYLGQLRTISGLHAEILKTESKNLW